MPLTGPPSGRALASFQAQLHHLDRNNARTRGRRRCMQHTFANLDGNWILPFRQKITQLFRTERSARCFTCRHQSFRKNAIIEFTAAAPANCRQHRIQIYLAQTLARREGFAPSVGKSCSRDLVREERDSKL